MHVSHVSKGKSEFLVAINRSRVERFAASGVAPQSQVGTDLFAQHELLDLAGDRHREGFHKRT